MPDAISNTSPLFYLHQIRRLDWLPILFDEIWTPHAVILELQEGKRRGYDVPNADEYSWLTIVNPRYIPSEWLALDLGPGELAAMSLALEHPQRCILLDDGLARRTAQAGRPCILNFRILSVTLIPSKSLMPPSRPGVGRILLSLAVISRRLCGV